MTETKHTQGKLKVVWKRCAYHIATNDIVVASCYPNDYQYNYVVRPKNEAECIANADFIVRACNAHDDLLEALEEVMDIAMQNPSGFDDSSNFDPLDTSPNDMNFHLASMQYHICRAVIAKAKGEEK